LPKEGEPLLANAPSPHTTNRLVMSWPVFPGKLESLKQITLPLKQVSLVLSMVNLAVGNGTTMMLVESVI
jgi:hypothetical protein